MNTKVQTLCGIFSFLLKYKKLFYNNDQQTDNGTGGGREHACLINGRLRINISLKIKIEAVYGNISLAIISRSRCALLFLTLFP